jgi:PAS domain S-box-containing protein
MELPLTARGHTVGTMIMATTTSRRRFTSDDLLFAAELAMRFSRAIDNARLFEAERAAHANAEKLAAERAAMLAQITDGVVIADRAGEIQFVNAVARRLLGMEPGDPFDPDHAAMVTVTRHDGSNLRLRELLAPAALTGQTTISGDWHIQRGNGTVAVVEAMAVPVVTERGEHLGAVLTLHDETTNRALERQKDEFLANVSHDLRTPLATIKTSIGVVLANEPPDLAEPLHRLLVNIDLAADRIGRLVSDLLDLARLQAGRVPVRRVEVDLREIARRSARVIEPLAQGRGQRLVIDLPKKPIVAHIDAGQMERALLNLLSNAHQHGRDGGLIQLRLSLQRAEAIIAVVDDGPGIAAADQERIFERFVRASGRNHTQQSGLGLAIARALVELNGGRIWVDETPGGGATFVIALPTREPPTDRARRRRR